MLHDIAEGQGDLTKKIEINTKDEIGDIALNFNNFITSIRKTIGNCSAINCNKYFFCY